MTTPQDNQRWRTIGEVCVDTGTIVICDPCQADEASAWCNGHEFVEALQNDNGAAQLTDNSVPLAVAVCTGIGDGLYKVEARYETHSTFGKRCAEIRIKFLPHPSEALDILVAG